MASVMITYDHLEDKSILLLLGSQQQDLKKYTNPIRLYDDDGELYYSGLTDHPVTDLPADEAFLALDWAGPHSGCTELKYLEGETWYTL